MNYIQLAFVATLEGNRNDLPPFLGATLRGALGYLLKKTVCQVSHGDCQRCLLQSACAYPGVFEGIAPPGREFMRKYPNIPQPFVLLVGPPENGTNSGSQLHWGMRLFGPACRYWPYVIHAFQTIGESGLGQRQVRYRLEVVKDSHSGENVWSQDQTVAAPREFALPASCTALPTRCNLRWRFETPVRLPSRNRELTGLDVLIAGKRRFEIMSHFYGEGTEAGTADESRFSEDEFCTLQSSLSRWEFSRFSGRQKQRMSLDGLRGELIVEGPWGQMGPWLSAAPVMHLGKATSFGFGRVSWELV